MLSVFCFRFMCTLTHWLAVPICCTLAIAGAHESLVPYAFKRLILFPLIIIKRLTFPLDHRNLDSEDSLKRPSQPSDWRPIKGTPAARPPRLKPSRSDIKVQTKLVLLNTMLLMQLPTRRTLHKLRPLLALYENLRHPVRVTGKDLTF